MRGAITESRRLARAARTLQSPRGMHDQEQIDEPELPSCRCGTTRESKFAVGEREYSLTGTFYLLWGGTAVPTKVTFRCVKCNRNFDVVSGSRARMSEYIV
jgi:hypothetical protein